MFCLATFCQLLSMSLWTCQFLLTRLFVVTVGECVTVVVLQRYPDLSGSQDILRATTGQLWRLELQWDSSALEERCPDYWEARLPEAGVQWGMVSPQDIGILLLSWRAATAEFCSAPLRGILAELYASSAAQDVSSANSLLGEAPCRNVAISSCPGESAGLAQPP